MKAWLIVALLLLAACANARPNAVEERAEPTPVVVFIDERAQSGGDGSAARPLNALPALLAGPGQWRLSAGIYPGPIVLKDGAVLEVVGQAVISGTEGVVVTSEGSTIKGLSIQGGTTGLLVRGETTLEGLHISGMTGQAVQVEGSTLFAKRLHVVGTRVGGQGLHVKGGEVKLVQLKLEGTFTHGIDNQGARLVIEGLESQGGGFGIRAVGGQTSVKDARFAVGRGAAIFVGAKGSLMAERIDVFGHPEALEVSSGARAVVRNIKIQRPSSAGITVVKAQLRLEHAEVSESGPQGALVVLDGDVEVEQLVVKRAKALGVLSRHGKLTLKKTRIEGVVREANGDGSSSLGDAVMARDSDVLLDAVTVRDVEGSALFAAAAARIKGTQLTVQRAAGGAVLVERGAKVSLGLLRVEGGREPALNVLEGGSAEIGHLDVQGSMPAIWAECGQGAQVVVGRVEGSTLGVDSPCVRRLKPQP